MYSSFVSFSSFDVWSVGKAFSCLVGVVLVGDASLVEACDGGCCVDSACLKRIQRCFRMYWGIRRSSRPLVVVLFFLVYHLGLFELLIRRECSAPCESIIAHGVSSLL
jgi:hypothetical protein